MDQRRETDCACTLWDIDPQQLREQGLEPGYCGICERCGDQGHTRHYPGPKPMTGAWCDRCYNLIGNTWFLRSPVLWIIYVALAVLMTDQLTG